MIKGGPIIVIHPAWTYVMDADQLGTLHHLAKGIIMDENGQGMDALREVGPGGHFFGCAHTQARYRTAFFAPMISDWRNYESWREAGAPTAYDTANRLYHQRLDAFVPPPMDPAIFEELEAFVARRKAEGGAPTDY